MLERSCIMALDNRHLRNLSLSNKESRIICNDSLCLGRFPCPWSVATVRSVASQVVCMMQAVAQCDGNAHALTWKRKWKQSEIGNQVMGNQSMRTAATTEWSVYHQALLWLIRSAFSFNYRVDFRSHARNVL